MYSYVFQNLNRFGWIHESLRQLVTRKYGQEAWLKILELANLNEPECEIAHYYKDEETMRLVQAVANVIGIPVEEVWEAYGSFLIHFTMETGWDELLRVMARNLEGFLDGLDSLHYFIDHVVYQTRLSGPSFRCEPQTDGTLRLHYYSKRNGLYPIVIGSYIKKAYPWCKRHETNLTDILELIHPEVPLTFESIMVFKNSQFVCKLKDIDGQESNVKAVMVKGSMTIVDNGQFMVYLCSLYVTTVRELIDRNLHLSDIQGHDGTRDLIMLNQSRLSQVELNRRLEETTKNLKRMASELETEKHKTDELLSQLMPISVAEALRQGTSVEACEFAEATLLFTDIVTFTNICAQCTPYDVVTLLNDLYLRFDRLVGLVGSLSISKYLLISAEAWQS
ncbi:Soluble guanylate cyclase gcy-35 [Toxocara canis]|uniref:Soluble guanylate cyclase gcy-35 n=1 Tax=Toxocara canis TaxID=6265 RepID=A0A0B2VWR4_TOXCA|nr:Soluble guanylate cyclase gcy-35 [Toxocara canis]